ncbi:MAG: phosphorylase [Spirulinaceae cyanobacterium]
MSETNTTLDSGTLWAKVKQQTHYALEGGALHSLPTEYELIEQDGIPFLVSILANIAHKERAKQQQEEKSPSGQDYNPFLPYEEGLFVADISDTHLCLLNKFNVVDDHILIVTREFEAQENLLSWEDFEAMETCLREIEGLAFYNSGKKAGASQRHKHLQLVPFPLVAEIEAMNFPLEVAIASTQWQDSVGKIPSLNFPHAIAKLDFPTSGEVIWQQYHQLLQTLGLNNHQQPHAYNLLATRKWLLIVPRSQESFQSISINSLGFVGSFFVRNHQQKQFLEEYGFLNVLGKVAT